VLKIPAFAKRQNVSGNHPTTITQKQTDDKSQLFTFFIRRKNLHHFQAHCKRAKRQQHFCKELEKYNIQLFPVLPIKIQKNNEIGLNPILII
jgi:hypothetical protein